MTIKKTITETRENLGNNESRVKAGIYLTTDNEYWWLTYTRSGVCKRLKTAQNKIA